MSKDKQAELAEKIWEPSPRFKDSARITHFLSWLQRERGVVFSRYDDLWAWSTDKPDEFWSAIWQYFDVPVKEPYRHVLDSDAMPGAHWFVGAELNFVNQIFRHADLLTPAITYESEAAGSGSVSWSQLRDEVAALAQSLRDLGVQRGDRVAAYLPNIPQTVVAFLAVASLGAVWSVCAPDMGPVSVGDRLRQIEPVVLIACDGYRFSGKAFDRRPVLDEVIRQLPTVRAVVWVRHLDSSAVPPPSVASRQVVLWEDAIKIKTTLIPEDLPADHPLWILYSSGTTGLPKAIVHGHGGILLNGLLTVGIHNDLNPGDRIFWTSSTSWMVWTAHVLSLLVGATIVLFDGAVTGAGDSPDWGHLWKLAGRQKVRSFGAGAAFYLACMKAGVVPKNIAELSSLDCISSTGSPLSPEGYHWLYDNVKRDLWLNCCSGGTDIAGGFLGGLPTLPVYIGEMQCRILGAAVHAFNDNGEPVMDEVGELVCTRPLPSMPLYFWGDKDNCRYQESYFDTFKGIDGRSIWRHGDWLKLIPREQAAGGIIYGRSDATINRQGIRMGTAELYRAVDAFEEVLDSLVVDLEYLGRESHMVLFVVLRSGQSLSEDLVERLRKSIKTSLSARHVPNDIVQVADVPKTLTGKKLELPIKKLMLGFEVEKVVNRDALANPACMDWYIDFARSYLAGVS